MHNETIVWTFETSKFRVEYAVAPDDDLDLSWDDDGSTREGLEDGSLVAFTACVRVVHRASCVTLGEDFLGGCIYASPRAFMDHRTCGVETRRLRASGSEAVCGSYFTDMIGEACASARGTWNERKRSVVATRLREVA